MIPRAIVIHHTASSPDTPIEAINAWHKERFNFQSKLGSYIGYHYVIDKNGKIHKCRQDFELGAHSIPNGGKIGIALVGDFVKKDPEPLQIASMHSLVNELKDLYNIVEVYGHRDCNRTECPGTNLYRYVLEHKIHWLKMLIKILLSKN